MQPLGTTQTKQKNFTSPIRDGSPHRWFSDKKSCLIAIIDDATSEIHAEFFDSETTLGCLKVLHDYIAKKGALKVLAPEHGCWENGVVELGTHEYLSLHCRVGGVIYSDSVCGYWIR